MAAKAIDFDPSQLEIRDLVLAVRCIDLTTLGGDDTACNVGRLVWRALNPLSAAILEKLQPLGIEQPWHSDLPIATTVAGFPAGQGTVEAALSEVHYAVNNGANEIDIVINRPLAIDGQWRQLYEEIRAVAELMRQKGTRLKVILSTGELGTLENIYRAATVAMPFVTSTCAQDGKVGLKPAGGLKDGADALYWLTLVRTQLGRGVAQQQTVPSRCQWNAFQH
ncbi:hypothetical protein TYRP_000560 [Tyrophagus putrescentiae]|nr:hypothetical protein TYRP_000560 [Tyrophagus putrescentiae]